MGAIRTLVNELRRRGVVVHEWPGWDGRGNEGVSQIDPVGAVLHHTASGYGSAFEALVSGRPDLRGTLCNFAGNADGSLTVIASGLAWHAGTAAGPGLGPLARFKGQTLNRHTVGLEIVYPGNQPMTDGQRAAALVFARTVADLFCGGDVEYVRAHAETNGRGGDGKWDPGFAPSQTIDMAAFRREAAAASTITEDDMLTDEQDRRLKGIEAVLASAATAWKTLAGKDAKAKDAGTLIAEAAYVLGKGFTEDRAGSETGTVKASTIGDKVTEIRDAVKVLKTGGVDTSAIADEVLAKLGPVLAPLVELAKKLED